MLFRCSRCLYPSSKPDIHFTDGVCSACVAFDKRKEVDWSAKRDEFLSIVGANPGSTHDVIVACSGGKDSTAQVLKCLELGLRPLAVTATTDHLTALGRRNLDNIKNLCDHVEITPHQPTRAKMAAFALRELGDISWCEHQLIWSIPAREAVARGIPVVLYGEAQNNEYGAGAKGTENVSRLDKKWMDEYGGLLGLRVSDMTDILGIPERNLELYRYPEGDVQALFMGAYFPWDGFENYQIAKAHGFTEYDGDVEGSLYGYENLDNAQTGAHDWCRWLKFGYSRACDIASSAIRRGRLTRDVAIDLVHSRDGAYPATYLGVPLKEMLARIGVTVSEFDAICARFTDHEVVDWASSRASYQSCSGTATDASKENNSVKTAA